MTKTIARGYAAEGVLASPSRRLHRVGDDRRISAGPRRCGDRRRHSARPRRLNRRSCRSHPLAGDRSAGLGDRSDHRRERSQLCSLVSSCWLSLREPSSYRLPLGQGPPARRAAACAGARAPAPASLASARMGRLGQARSAGPYPRQHLSRRHLRHLVDPDRRNGRKHPDRRRHRGGCRPDRDNIRELGFKLSDVRILLHSHEHNDHVGGLARLQQLSGAQLFASPAAAKVFETGTAGTATMVRSLRGSTYSAFGRNTPPPHRAADRPDRHDEGSGTHQGRGDIHPGRSADQGPSRGADRRPRPRAVPGPVPGELDELMTARTARAAAHRRPGLRLSLAPQSDLAPPSPALPPTFKAKSLMETSHSRAAKAAELRHRRSVFLAASRRFQTSATAMRMFRRRPRPGVHRQTQGLTRACAPCRDAHDRFRRPSLRRAIPLVWSGLVWSRMGTSPAISRLSGTSPAGLSGSLSARTWHQEGEVVADTGDLDALYAASYRRLVVQVYAICATWPTPRTPSGGVRRGASQRPRARRGREHRCLDAPGGAEPVARGLAAPSVVLRSQAAVPARRAPVEVGPEHVAIVTALAQLDPNQRRVRSCTTWPTLGRPDADRARHPRGTVEVPAEQGCGRLAELLDRGGVTSCLISTCFVTWVTRSARPPSTRCGRPPGVATAALRRSPLTAPYAAVVVAVIAGGAAADRR